MKAIIFIAHGSKKDKSNNEFTQMIEYISKNEENYDLKGAAFLEFALPDINTMAINFIKKGAKEIKLYPFFLNSGKHVLIDIPNIVDELKKKYPNITFILMNHFGKSEKIKEIILSDIK